METVALCLSALFSEGSLSWRHQVGESPIAKTKVWIPVQFSLTHVKAFLHIYISSSHNNNPPGALCNEDIFRASWNSSNQSRTEIKTGNIYECLSSVWLLSSGCLRLRVPVSAETACHPKQKSVSPARFLISQKGPVLRHSSQETAELADKGVKEILLANLCALSKFVATSRLKHTWLQSSDALNSLSVPV